MGCDIHFLLEERTPAGWRFCRCYEHPGADIVAEKKRYDKHAAKYEKQEAANQKELEETGGYCCFGIGAPEELIAKQLEGLDDRNYERFAMLSKGVAVYRAPEVPTLPFVYAMSADGLPPDASSETKEHLGSDPMNRHSHGHFLSKDFVDFEWATKWDRGGRTAREIFEPDVVDALLSAFNQEPMRQFRIVYNFDN